MTDELTAATNDPAAGEFLDDAHLLDALLEHLPDFVYFKDRAGRYVRASKSVAEWHGLTDSLELIGRTDADFLGPDLARLARVDEDEILRTGKAIVDVRERDVHDGRVTWVSTTKAPLRDRAGTIVGILGVSRDVTRRKSNEDLIAEQASRLVEQAQSLRDLATRDDLTGLLNRRGFFDEAATAMLHAREQGLRAAMLFVDLDGLKQINDADGHPVGDRALVAVADALRTVTEPPSVVGRVGGDEFCVLETARPRTVFLTEHVLHDAIADAAASAGLPELSASIGRVAASPEEDLDHLIARSDVEMYARKAQRFSN